MKTEETFIGGPRVLERYGITRTTMQRWLADPKLNFPKPMVRRNRLYFKVGDLEAWERERGNARRE